MAVLCGELARRLLVDSMQLKAKLKAKSDLYAVAALCGELAKRMLVDTMQYGCAPQRNQPRIVGVAAAICYSPCAAHRKV